MFRFYTWNHVFYLESSDESCLGNIPPAGGKDVDVGELLWFRVFLSPHRLTVDEERKHVDCPPLGLADLQC